MAVPCGTPVGAARPGTVVKAGWAGGNGIRVMIDHQMVRGYRVVTTYNHLSSIGVRVGQQVEALDGIGRVGSTGYSTGCHLHFEVIVNGQFTDPAPWLNGDPVVIDLSKMQPTSVPSASPVTGTPSASATPSQTPSIEPPTMTPSGSPTPSGSGSPGPTPSGSPSPTMGSPTASPSSVEPSATHSPTAVPAETATATPTGTASPAA